MRRARRSVAMVLEESPSARVGMVVKVMRLHRGGSLSVEFIW